MAGVSLYIVQKLLGHQSLAMTERYAHLAPNYLRDAVNSLTSGAQVTPELTPVKRQVS